MKNYSGTTVQDWNEKPRWAGIGIYARSIHQKMYSVTWKL